MQLKKILSIFLAAALIFSVSILNVGAEVVETFEVGVEAETATPVSSSPKIFNTGDDVSVKISVDQNTGISFLKFVVYFNAEALEFINHESNNLFNSESESIQVKDGYIIYFVNLIDAISDNEGELFSVNFRVKSSYCGEAEIYTELFQNRQANCAKYYSPAKNTYVPFEGLKDSFSIHSIDLSCGEVTLPTCTEDGFTTYDCSNCNKKVIGNIVDKLGHINAEEVEENRLDPTCTEKGSYDSVIYCERCNTELSRESHFIDELGHDLVHHDAKEPTCTEIGWNAYDTCTRCDYTTYVEKAALNHDLVHHDAKEPTCTEIGWNAYDTCSRCDYTTYAEIDALGHKYGETTVIKPQYKVDGYSTHTCTVCGNEEKFDFTAALTYPSGEYLVYEDGIWYYLLNGEKVNATTLVKYYGTWYYVENGKVNWNATTLCKYGDTWYYVQNGEVNWNATTLCNYYGTWYYVQNGEVNWNATTLCNYYGTWYYVQNGVLNFNATTLCNYGNTWYYVENGAVNFNANRVFKYYDTFYVVRGGVVIL